MNLPQQNPDFSAEILQGDLLFTPAGAILCPCSQNGKHDLGICRQILHLAGSEIEKQIRMGNSKPGSFITGSGRLAMRRIGKIIHLNVSPEPPLKPAIETALDQALVLSVKNNLAVLSLGSLNATAFGLSWQDAATLAGGFIAKARSGSGIRQILIRDSNSQFISKLVEVYHAPA